MLTKLDDNKLRFQQAPGLIYIFTVVALGLTATGSWATYYGCRGFFRSYGPDWDAIAAGAGFLIGAAIVWWGIGREKQSPSSCVIFDLNKKQAKVIVGRENVATVPISGFFPLTIEEIESTRRRGQMNYVLFSPCYDEYILWTNSKDNVLKEKKELEEQLGPFSKV